MLARRPRERIRVCPGSSRTLSRSLGLPRESEEPGPVFRAGLLVAHCLCGSSERYLSRPRFARFTWQLEQKVSWWQSKHGVAPVFLTTVGWYFSHGVVGTDSA